MTSPEPMFDYRARMERARLEAVERRERALIDQCSPVNSPEMRIRVWEGLHQVRLPKDPKHAILRMVSKQTALTLAEVLEVQRQRIPAS